MALGFSVLGTPLVDTSGLFAYTHGAVTPSGSAAVLVACGSSGTLTATVPALDSPTWLSGAWERFESPDQLYEIDVFVGLTVASPSSDDVTENFNTPAPDQQTGCAIAVINITGADLADVVVQGRGTGSAGASGTGVQTLTSPLSNPSNAVLSVLFIGANETMTATSGTKLVDTGYAAPTRQLGVFYEIGNDDVQISWTSTVVFNLMMFEIAAAAAAAPAVVRNVSLVL